MNKLIGLCLILSSTACGENLISLPKGGDVTFVKKTGSITINLTADEATKATYIVDQELRFTIPHEISAPLHGVPGDIVTLWFGPLACYYSNLVLSGLFEYQYCLGGFLEGSPVYLPAKTPIVLSVVTPVSSPTLVQLTLVGEYQ